jgi:selenide,water dikinase
MGPGDLKHTLCSLVPKNENVLVGFENSEDACVFKINENEALVQTVDFITPVVDDPYVYGKVAAANSLSDIFAMGADVKTALNVVGFDKTNHTYEVLAEILRGGNDKIEECGGVLLGGHTIETPEMYYGLSVTGMIHPKDILRNNTPKIGHVLVLTKPIGIGILTTAIKRDLLSESTILETVRIMETLNYMPSKLLKKYDVSACTDVTGFSLLGHALETSNDNVSLMIDSASVPIIVDAFELGEEGVVPGGSKKNKAYLADKVSYLGDSEKLSTVLCDAQTSGGLLISMNEEDAKEYIKEVEEYTFGYARIIGEIIPRKDKAIIVH